MNTFSVLCLSFGLATLLAASLAHTYSSSSVHDEKNELRFNHDKVIKEYRRRRLERMLPNIGELRQQYFEYHNRSLEDEEIEHALRVAEQKPGNSWDELFRPKIDDAMKRRKVIGAQNQTSISRRRSLQTIRQEQGFLITALSPGLVDATQPVWCAAIRKITNNGKVREGILTLKNCEATPEAEIAVEYTTDFNIQWHAATAAATGNNIFAREYCIGVGRASPSARLRTEVCDLANANQIWGILAADATWRLDPTDFCATARTGKNRGAKGGGKIVLKKCGNARFSQNQDWLYCFRGALCTFIGEFLECDFQSECE
uniref:Uncharacterized protein n=1 Tax=Odontella aurita TaxID=265563 RepID=A0A6U6HQ55_9STRA|mmetsp:Transcript_48907/g.147349  ORF Transcript_48907/g.147349 Transcript_48907/m.147349 type:complete len:316 (+) Transcript_48907:118-1065(+)